MATRIVEGKKPYTGGQAIEVTEDKVINLKLRAENNLIIYDHGDDEIYVDLQLSDEIEPTDAFPVGVNTGRVIVDNGWDKTGTIIVAKTTSGDNIKLLYADDGTLWVDNGTGTFKQIYLKGDIDTIVSTLTDYIDAHDTVVSDTAPSDPYEGQLWYDTTNDALKVYNGSQWTTTGGGGGGSGDVVGPSSATDGHLAVFDGATGKLIKDGGAVPTGDVEVSTQANNIFSSGMKIWGGTQANYESLTPDSNTAYLIVASQPTPPSPGRQPGVNTLVYLPLDGDADDYSGNSRDGTLPSNYSRGTLPNSKQCFSVSGQAMDFSSYCITGTYSNTALGSGDRTMSIWVKINSGINTSQVTTAFIGNGNGATQGEWFGIWHMDHDSGALGILRYYDDPYTTSYSYDNNWHNYIITYNSANKGKVYADGVQIAMTNNASVSFDTLGTTYAVGLGRSEGIKSIDFSSFILEDKERTAQEISDYYDLTKGDYGIS